MRVLLERALTIQERAYGQEHCEVAITLANLGAAYSDVGEVEKGQATLLRAFCILSHEHHPLADEVKQMLSKKNISKKETLRLPERGTRRRRKQKIFVLK